MLLKWTSFKQIHFCLELLTRRIRSGIYWNHNHGRLFIFCNNTKVLCRSDSLPGVQIHRRLICPWQVWQDLQGPGWWAGGAQLGPDGSVWKEKIQEFPGLDPGLQCGWSQDMEGSQPHQYHGRSLQKVWSWWEHERLCWSRHGSLQRWQLPQPALCRDCEEDQAVRWVPGQVRQVALPLPAVRARGASPGLRQALRHLRGHLHAGQAHWRDSHGGRKGDQRCSLISRSLQQESCYSQVVGVKSGDEIAKCKQVYCDPSYARWFEIITIVTLWIS